MHDLKPRQYVGIARRTAALALDSIPIVIYVALLFAAGFGLSALLRPFRGGPRLAVEAVSFLLTVFPVSLYFALQEGSDRQASWGKRLVGIRVIDLQGRGITRRRALGRALVKLLPWQLGHTAFFSMSGAEHWPYGVEFTPMAIALYAAVWLLVGVYLVSLALRKDHRTPYDWISGTIVIRDADRPGHTHS